MQPSPRTMIDFTIRYSELTVSDRNGHARRWDEHHRCRMRPWPGVRIGERLPRSFFEREVTVVARDLSAGCWSPRSAAGTVAVRLTEVEAYAGVDDPASHAFRGRTPRTAVMFGPAGHLYTYFVYGMHWCANIVTGAGRGCLGRAAARRGGGRRASRSPASGGRAVDADHELARGPAGLATVLGLTGADTGADLCRAGRPAATSGRRCAGGRHPGRPAGRGVHRGGRAVAVLGVRRALGDRYRAWNTGDAGPGRRQRTESTDRGGRRVRQDVRRVRELCDRRHPLRPTGIGPRRTAAGVAWSP